MQKEYFGIGTLRQVQEILGRLQISSIFLVRAKTPYRSSDIEENIEQLQPTSIFFVTGKVSCRTSGAEEELIQFLRGFPLVEFTEYSANPQWEDVLKGIELWRFFRPSLVVAMGGGSTLDIAKAITLLAEQEGNPELYLKKIRRCSPRKTPLLAIPTTAGTGAETTHFATVYIGKTKCSLAHSSLIPDYAVIDPSLTFTLSPRISAVTGMDALCQAIESYWSVLSTEESKQHAREAIELILNTLETVVHSPTPASRLAMAKAANFSGKAINISFTTACHAISYPITSFFNISHGHAVALTLPEMINYNSEVTETDCLDQRGVPYVQKIMGELYTLFGVKSAMEMKQRFEQLMDNLGLERALSRLGICNDQDVKIIIKNGFNPERVKNNPRQVTEEKLKAILERLR